LEGTDVEEIDLIRRAQQGDRTLFEEIVRRTSQLVFARVCLETGDPQRAEDLVQETYLTAFRSIRQLVDPRGLRGWLTTIAQTVCIDAYRRDNRQRRQAPPRTGSDALDRISDGATGPDEAMARGETSEQVLSILRSLPEEYRAPLTLRYLGGADFESITIQLGITPGSLRGLLNRGLQLLRTEFNRAMGPEIAGGIS
jgi:RNA polymerase sigma-70 factor (ECF subfamily)